MIEIKNVCKEYDGNTILNNINVNFNEGHIYGLIGRNGSGKTVLLNMICGFIYPSDGEILIDKKNIHKNKIFAPNTRALIEKPKFLSNMSGYKNLELLANINKLITEDDINNTLRDVDLFDEKDKLYNKYSLGMKQKLGIAQVLMENPKIMIFDEPFNGLDEQSSKKLRNLLKNIKNDKIIIIATHIKDDIEDLCDVVYKIDNGMLSKYGL